MRQLIARIDEGLHARLKRRAAREGRSLNALVTDALEAAAVEQTRPRDELQRRARGVWPSLPVAGRQSDHRSRRALIERTKDVGRPASDELASERRSGRG